MKPKARLKKGNLLSFYISGSIVFLKTEYCINFNYIICSLLLLYRTSYFISYVVARTVYKNSLEDTLNVLFDINIAGDISKLFQILLICQLVKLCVLRTIHIDYYMLRA